MKPVRTTGDVSHHGRDDVPDAAVLLAELVTANGFGDWSKQVFQMPTGELLVVTHVDDSREFEVASPSVIPAGKALSLLGVEHLPVVAAALLGVLFDGDLSLNPPPLQHTPWVDKPVVDCEEDPSLNWVVHMYLHSDVAEEFLKQQRAGSVPQLAALTTFGTLEWCRWVQAVLVSRPMADGMPIDGYPLCLPAEVVGLAPEELLAVAHNKLK